MLIFPLRCHQFATIGENDCGLKRVTTSQRQAIAFGFIYCFKRIISYFL